MNDDFESKMERQLAVHRQKLINHQLYRQIDTLEKLRIFTEMHVYAVWDFMSLLKFLQRNLTCLDVPWVPSENARCARIINEIVLCEESDATAHGKNVSHLELYLNAMNSVGASTESILGFIKEIRNGKGLDAAFETANTALEVQEFVVSTFNLIRRAKVHEVAAAFAYGREDLLPEVFGAILHELERKRSIKAEDLNYYFERHVDIDGGDHAGSAKELVKILCQGNPVAESEAIEAAVSALSARLRLWNAVSVAMQNGK
jgi:hypothetical protein